MTTRTVVLLAPVRGRALKIVLLCGAFGLAAAGLLVALAFVDRVLFWLWPPSRGWRFT